MRQIILSNIVTTYRSTLQRIQSEEIMTVNQAQEALNKAYFAMTNSPTDKQLADVYWNAREDLWLALEFLRKSN